MKDKLKEKCERLNKSAGLDKVTACSAANWSPVKSFINLNESMDPGDRFQLMPSPRSVEAPLKLSCKEIMDLFLSICFGSLAKHDKTLGQVRKAVLPVLLEKYDPENTLDSKKPSATKVAPLISNYALYDTEGKKLDKPPLDSGLQSMFYLTIFDPYDEKHVKHGVAKRIRKGAVMFGKSCTLSGTSINMQAYNCTAPRKFKDKRKPKDTHSLMDMDFDSSLDDLFGNSQDSFDDACAADDGSPGNSKSQSRNSRKTHISAEIPSFPELIKASAEQLKGKQKIKKIMGIDMGDRFTIAASCFDVQTPNMRQFKTFSKKFLYQPLKKFQNNLNEAKENNTGKTLGFAFDETVYDLERLRIANPRTPDAVVQQAKLFLSDKGQALYNFYNSYKLEEKATNGRKYLLTQYKRAYQSILDKSINTLFQMLGVTPGRKLSDKDGKYVIGIGLRGKSGLSCGPSSIAGVLERLITIKARAIGIIVLGVDEYNTTARCPCCGGANEKILMRVLLCRTCSKFFHRDIAENIMILVMLKLIGKQRPVHLTVGFVDTVLKDPEKSDYALNSQ